MPKKKKGNISKDTTIPFGELLIIDAYECDPLKLNNMELCAKVLEDLTVITGMRKISEPYIIRSSGNETLGGKDPGGYSGFLIIQESHISIHTFVNRGFLTIDLYSCKSFSSEGVIEYLQKLYSPTDIDILKLGRGLKYPRENIYDAYKVDDIKK